MRIHLLGVNGPFPESGGAASGYLLQAEETLLQLDLGSGTLARLTAKAAPERLSALFLAHWHFDHVSDLPVLMYRLEAMGFGANGNRLPVYAPADESSVIRRIAAASPCFDLRNVVPGDEIVFGSCRVRIGEARHPVPAVSFRAEENGRVFGYTGDTNTLPGLTDFFRGVNLLLADGLFPEEVWSEQKPHLSAALAAAMAADAGVQQLVLTHLNPLFPPDLLLSEARRRHRNVLLAEAGRVLDI